MKTSPDCKVRKPAIVEVLVNIRHLTKGRKLRKILAYVESVVSETD
jgi:hypothetical protein